MEGLDTLFIISGVQDGLLPQVSAGPEPALDLEVVPKCLVVNGVLGGLILVDYIKMSGTVQDTGRCRVR